MSDFQREPQAHSLAHALIAAPEDSNRDLNSLFFPLEEENVKKSQGAQRKGRPLSAWGTEAFPNSKARTPRAALHCFLKGKVPSEAPAELGGWQLWRLSRCWQPWRRCSCLCAWLCAPAADFSPRLKVENKIQKWKSNSSLWCLTNSSQLQINQPTNKNQD